MMRRTNTDRVVELVSYLDAHEGQSFSKAELAHILGMGMGRNLDAVLTRARHFCAEQGWAYTYFATEVDGKWRASLTKTDGSTPVAGIETRMKSIAGQMANVRKQAEFVRRHAPDVLTANIGKIVEASAISLTESSALLRLMRERILVPTDTDPT